MLEEVAKRKKANATMFEATVSAAHKANVFARKMAANLHASGSGRPPQAAEPTSPESTRSSRGSRLSRRLSMRSSRLSRHYSGGGGSATVAPDCCTCDGQTADRMAEQAHALHEEAAAAEAQAAAARAAAEPAATGTVAEADFDPNEDPLERVKRHHAQGLRLSVAKSTTRNSTTS